MNGPSSLSPDVEEPTCDLCAKAKAKYTCPSCSTRSCSLLCVRAHKISSNCTGVRPAPVKFRPVSAYTEKDFHDEVSWLEDITGFANALSKRRHAILEEVSGGKRVILKKDENTVVTPATKKKRDTIESICEGLAIKWIPAPPFSSRFRSNRTYIKDEQIFWTVECMDSVEKKPIFLHNCDGRMSLLDIIRQLANQEGLQASCHESVLWGPLQKTYSDSGGPLELHKSLVEHLRGRTVVEYPRFLFAKQASCRQ